MISSKIGSVIPLVLKRKLAIVLSNKYTGFLLGLVYRNKIPFHGVIVDTGKSEFVRRKTVSDLFFKIYERAEIDHVRSHLDGTYDVIELGGSIGVNSMQIKKKLYPGKQLLIVEAAPHLAQILQSNLDLNALNQDVKVLNRAIDYSGAKEVHFCVEESSLSGKVNSASTSKTVTVGTTNLLEIITENSFGEFVLVSDIEGMEIPIFLEDQDALKNCKQIFLEIDGVEYKGEKFSINDIICQIEGLGFEIIDQYHNCVCFNKKF